MNNNSNSFLGVTWGLWLLALVGAGSVLIGLFFPIGEAYRWIRYTGLIFIALLVLAWLSSFAVLFKRRLFHDGIGSKGDWLYGAVVVLLAMFTLNLGTEPSFGVMDDEGTLANTALSIYETGEVFSAHRGYWVEDNFEIVDGRLDKRPWLYPTIVAACHHLFGYNLQHSFEVNYWISILTVFTLWLFLRHLFSPQVAFIAALPLIWNPVWLQSASGGGLEPVNYFLITMMGSALFYYQREGYGKAPEAFIVFCATLLAYARYESAVWIVAVGVFLILKGGGITRYKPALTTFFAAILLIPTIWLLRLTFARTDGFQEGGTEELPVFGLSYLGENFIANSLFLLAPSWRNPNDLLITVVGAAGLILGGIKFCQCCRQRQWHIGQRPALATWLVGFAVMYFVYASYFWGSFRDPLAVRFSLVTLFPFLVGVAFVFREATKKLRNENLLTVAACVLLLICSLPNISSQQVLQDKNPHARSQNWKYDWLQAQQLSPESTFIIDNHPQVWTASRYSSITTEKLMPRLKALNYQMSHGGFKDTFLVETLRLNTNGEWSPVYPEIRNSVQLESVAEAHYQLTSNLRTQISRVVGVKGMEGASDALDREPYDPFYLP